MQHFVCQLRQAQLKIFAVHILNKAVLEGILPILFVVCIKNINNIARLTFYIHLLTAICHSILTARYYNMTFACVCVLLKLIFLFHIFFSKHPHQHQYHHPTSSFFQQWRQKCRQQQTFLMVFTVNIFIISWKAAAAAATERNCWQTEVAAWHILMPCSRLLHDMLQSTVAQKERCLEIHTRYEIRNWWYWKQNLGLHKSSFFYHVEVHPNQFRKFRLAD